MTAPHAPLAGRREWLAAMQATLGACACCLLVAWLAPSVRPWVPLVLAVLWFRGPIGFLLPVGLEPVLMEYGASHPVVVVVAVTAIASAVAETISLRVMRGMASLEALAKTSHSLRGSRIVRLFERSPGAAVAFGALSPVPDWITRSLAAVSGYQPARYVVADTLGRLPKLWIPAAAGGLVSVDPMLTRVFLLSQIVLVGGIVGLRWHRSRRRWRTSADCMSGKAVVPFAWGAVLAAFGAIAPAHAQSVPATPGAASLVVVEFGGASINGAESAFGGLHFTRLLPRRPGFDVGLQVHRFFREERNDLTALAFDFGTAFRLPTGRMLHLVPGLGLSAVGTSDGGAALGLNASAHLVWRIGRVSLRGGGLVRGLMGGPTVMASGSLGIGFTP